MKCLYQVITVALCYYAAKGIIDANAWMTILVFTVTPVSLQSLHLTKFVIID